MRKLSIILLAALAMISCGKTYKAQDVELLNQTDSINFAVGMLHGLQINRYYMANDSSDETIAEFIDALEQAYQGEEEEELSDIAQNGRQIGMSVKSFEQTGLAAHEAWTLNEKLFFQGLVNGLYNDTLTMTSAEADEFLRQSYQTYQKDEKAKVVHSKCPYGPKAVVLKSHLDSVNYAFGFVNGTQMRTYLLANDEDGTAIDELIENINIGLNSKVRNPQLVELAKNIGGAIREQEPVGLMGVAGLETNFDLIKQGFINGLYNRTTQFDMQSAHTYVHETVSNLQYGENKAKGAQFLVENSLRDGVYTTESGLQYEILRKGKGPKPTAESIVKVHYEGTLIDGTVFDSSYERGEPIEFPLTRVIPGWTEGLQLMSKGAKYKLYIPYELGYGAQDKETIPPYSTLIFTVELLDFK